MGNSGLWLLAPALSSVPAASLAQAAQPPAAPPAKPAEAKIPSEEKTVDEVTVTAGTPDVQTSIDRRSYSLGKDIQATTGSIGDALRNVPSVEVDLQGGLTLRGDPNVTILVDGRPSAQFNGPGRADALQQLPADQIERVEVMTNPSAAVNPEGSGGVINLVMKTSRGAGRTGSAYVTAGSAGLKRAGGTFGYNSKKLTVTGNVSGNYQRNKQTFSDDRTTLDPTTGAVLRRTNIEGIGRNLARGPTGRLTVGYALDPKTQFTGEIQYNELLLYGYPTNRFRDFDAAGAPIGFLNRQAAARRYLGIDTGVSAGWRRTLAGDGHELSIDVIRNQSRPRDRTNWTDVQSFPVSPAPFEFVQYNAVQQHSEFKLAYSRPLPGSAKLKTGYELKYDDNDYVNFVARGATPGALTPDPTVSNDFRFKQTINTAYAIYERPFGDLTLQAGLRLEDVDIELNQVTSGQTDAIGYFRAYPSLHLGYKLDDEQKISASYSRRVQRPPAGILNPFPIYIDSRNIQQGNPRLKPQETDSFELGYERREGPSFLQATAYYRRNQGEFNYILRDLGDGTFLNTFDNLGSSRAMGLELVANGRFTPKLTYNVSSNIYWSQIDAANLGFVGRRSGYGIGGRANLSWQVTSDDLLQLNAFAQGKRLQAQGFLEPVRIVNLGWRHKVNDRVTATVTVQDLLATNRFARKLDTPVLRDRFEGIPVTRAVFLRLDYRFGGGGGKPPREPGFEFEQGAAPTP